MRLRKYEHRKSTKKPHITMNFSGNNHHVHMNCVVRDFLLPHRYASISVEKSGDFRITLTDDTKEYKITLRGGGAGSSSISATGLLEHYEPSEVCGKRIPCKLQDDGSVLCMVSSITKNFRKE